MKKSKRKNTEIGLIGIFVAATLVVTPVVASASGLVQGVDYGPYGGSGSKESSSSGSSGKKSSTKLEEEKAPVVTLADGAAAMLPNWSSELPPSSSSQTDLVYSD